MVDTQADERQMIKLAHMQVREGEGEGEMIFLRELLAEKVHENCAAKGRLSVCTWMCVHVLMTMNYCIPTVAQYLGLIPISVIVTKVPQ